MNHSVMAAGAGRADITPHVGTCLYGYAPDIRSVSVHDRLFVTVLALRQGGKSALLVNITAGDLQTELAGSLRSRLAGRFGIPASNVLLSVTHTHSAPNISGEPGWGGIDEAYIGEFLLSGLDSAAEQALAAMAECEVAVGTVRSEVGVNRRQVARDGAVFLGQNPWGPLDAVMTVASLRDRRTHRGILNLIHYGCHGTAAGCNREITRDWPGVMTDCLERESGTVTAFWNGAMGDSGPRLANGKTTGDIRYMEELGGVAASDAMRAWRSLGPYLPGKLDVFTGEMRLPYRPLPGAEKAERDFLPLEGTDPETLTNIERSRYDHLRALRDWYREGRVREEEALHRQFTAVSLGEIVLLPYPCEIFSEISMRLREYLPWRHVLVLSNTNGYEAYQPTRDQLCRGGYEVECFLNKGPETLADDTDQHLIDETLRIVLQREKETEGNTDAE